MPGFKTEDATKVREQAQQAVGGAVEQARTPLLAALGAGDLAAQTLLDAVQKVRTQLNERAEAAQRDLPTDLGELRGKLDPAELRKRVDSYTRSARELYDYLAERGGETLDRIQAQPQVKVAQDKVQDTAEDVRDVADDVLGKVTRNTRSAGEKAARQTEEAAAEAAEKVQEAGAKAASSTRSTARKAANKTESARGSASEG
ncbi:hypothetical protein [Saccharopolyspora cebuensis]|uniref:Heparin binding hemagglutinin HbhA n=1 Tax=Saccharopolyspora cebuensis TaxID=418759 RepID=A0ABV4CK44_9PSEU